MNVFKLYGRQRCVLFRTDLLTISIFFLVLATIEARAESQTFRSPYGAEELCDELPDMPGVKYSKSDKRTQAEMCAIDIYDPNGVALCPKTWSTSPGTMLYKLAGSGLSQSEYESYAVCKERERHKTAAKFKQTMNQKGTSGTHSMASLLYFHFSRYFDTSVTVPVAVFRSIDRRAHFERVTKDAHENRRGQSTQNRAGWKWLYEAEQNPSVYSPVRDLFVDDQQQIYGALIESGSGDRYGKQINGIRSGWGARDNRDFQETPVFLALRSEKPLGDAIAEGLSAGLRNAEIRSDMGPVASNEQMQIWMKEISEIVVLDYIFGQQDRIGNINFKWYVYWQDPATGDVKRDKIDSSRTRKDMARIDYPKELDGMPTQLIQRTMLFDNDAAGLKRYANFTKETKMLEKLRHFDGEFYRRLLALDSDLQANGSLAQYLATNFELTERDLNVIRGNVKDATTILRNSCRAGKLRFDLHGTRAVMLGETSELEVDCDGV